MPDYTLAIDAGTTSVRALIFDEAWAISGRGQRTLPLISPQSGYVEQSPESLWDHSLTVIKKALGEAGLRAAEITSLGITSQRSSCVIWERNTGIALTPIISWQDLRGIQRSAELAALGFPLFPASAACKLEAALALIPDGRERLERGELCWGNVDSYLAFRLSSGELFATDLSQACATGYLDFDTQQWSVELLAAQQLPHSYFPTLVDTSGDLGMTDPAVLGAAIPIRAIVGDQQSAAIAQDCAEPGDLKFTFGTSGTCNVHTGEDIHMVPGTYPLVLQRRDGRTDYCLEAMIVTAGAMIDWLSVTMNLPDLAANLDTFLADTNDSAGVLVLPALQGLGSPHARPNVTAQIVGLTRSTTQQHIIFAALEGIAFRTREILDHLAAHSTLPRPEFIRIDGGLTHSDTFVRILSDLLQQPVRRCHHAEATVLGAARLARGVMQDHTWSGNTGATNNFIRPSPNSQERITTHFVRWQTAFALEPKPH